MAVFAKIFNVKNSTEQVLIVKEGWDDAESAFILKTSTQVDMGDNVILTASVGAAYLEENEDTYHQVFDEYDQERAEQFRKGIEESFAAQQG